MDAVRSLLADMQLPRGDHTSVPTSSKRFPDGAQFRVEIPSVEGPEVMKSVMDQATRRGVPVHRVSQGSGGMLLTDEEILAMSSQGRQANVEVCLFARPQAGWSPSASAQHSTASLASQVRGADQLVHNIEEIRRVTDLGIRSVLITDLGVADVVSKLRDNGGLPAGLRLKASVQMGLANPASIRVGASLGLDSYNVSSDLTLSQLAEIRSAIDIPLDFYIETPDNLGGFIRYYEIAEIVRVAAPVYLKFGLRNSPDIYPSGTHLELTAISLANERVRRAEIGLSMLRRFMPGAVMSEISAMTHGVPQTTGEVAYD